MKASFKNINEIFEFKGLWDVPSKCGLKIRQKKGQYIIVVSELYQDNPGTSVTQASCSLAKQVCEVFHIPMDEIIFIEHNPDMSSKLSFYDEEFYLVEFDINNDHYINPVWTQLTGEQLRGFLNK